MNPLLLITLFLLPHGDLDIRIAEKTAEIQADPTNYLLYMQRGMLHAQHEQPDSALADYHFALSNGLDTSLIHLLTAEAFLEKENTADGLNSVATFLKMEPGHLKGIHVRAKLYEAQKNFDEAIADFEHVLHHAESPRPQDFIALADLYFERDTADFKNGINVLNRGRKRLGNIISLEMKLYSIEKKRSNFSGAHAVLDRMMKPLTRKERLLVEKAELFLIENRVLEATETLTQAENLIAALPVRFQNIPATQKLKQHIEELKQQL